MRLEQLQYVQAINKHESLSQAATALYINQPTLSRALASLEKELGVQLFKRSYQGVTLTPIGYKMLPHFEQILTEMAQVQALAATEKAQDISGTLTISAGSILCNNILLDISATFNQCYPLIDVDIIEEYTPDTIRRVYQNQADIGFISLADYLNGAGDNLLPHLEQYHLIYHYLIKTPMVAVLPGSSPLATQGIVTLEQLQAYPMFLPRKVKSVLPQDTDNSDYHYCPDRESRNKMILKQHGCTVISQLEMLDDIYVQQGLLVLRPIAPNDTLGNTMELGMIYHAERVLKCFEEDFIAIVHQVFKNIVFQ